MSLLSKIQLSKLSVKLPLAATFLVIVTAGIVGALALNVAETNSEEQAMTKLEAITDERSQTLDKFLGGLREDLQVFSGSSSITSAMTDFNSGWNGVSGDKTKALQELYIEKNPNKAGEKDKMDDAGDGSLYTSFHKMHHGWFASFVNTKGLYDVFLINTKGEVIYTYFKELDFASNLDNGQWAKTGLGDIYREGMKAEKNQIVFSDWAPYAPSADVPASFMGVPVFDAKGARMGVLAIQMPVARINEILSNRTGLGKTGQVFLVNKKGQFLSDLSSTKDDETLKKQISHPKLDQVFEGKEVTLNGNGQFIKGYSDTDDIIADFQPFNYFGHEKLKTNGAQWAMVSLQHMSEVDEPTDKLKNQLLLVCSLLALGMTLLAAFLIRQQVSKPITMLVDSLKKLAAGDLNVSMAAASRNDELGDIGKTMAVFKEAMELRSHSEEEQKVAAEETLRRQAFIDQLINDFRDNMGVSMASVQEAAERMDVTSKQLNTIAESADKDAQDASGASTETAENIQTVASATEEMAASIREISQQVVQATQVVGRANEMATGTNAQVQQLDGAAMKIGEIVSLIQSIAEQTNLLALNATIEAARAGEAGKGFAVVASEVKNLAVQTARATDEIAQQIGGIQSTTKETVDAIQNIVGTMEDVERYTSAIAAAIEEQNAATQEISRSVQNAATGSMQLSNSIQSVSSAIGETGQASDIVVSVVNDLNKSSTEMKQCVEKFLQDVAAA